MLKNLVLNAIRYFSQIVDPDPEMRSYSTKKWTPVDKNEIKAYLCIVIAMGIVNLPDVRSYWSKGISQVPWFPSIISFSRFSQISRFLHLADNQNAPDRDHADYKLYKLGKIHETVARQSKLCYVPTQ